MDKLNISTRKEDIMQSESDFRKPELAEKAGDSRRKADEGIISALAKVKPAIPADFDGDWEKGHTFFNTCCIYLTVVGNLFPNNQSQIYWVLSFFKLD